MTDEELIEKAKEKLEAHGVPFGEFWCINRTMSSYTTVWFWRKDDSQGANPSVQFDEERGQALWCNQ